MALPSTSEKLAAVIVAAGISLVFPALTFQAAAQVVLKQEPQMGRMREGQVVFVDDGSCPKGQIKEVTGGNHVKVGGTKHIERTHRCISR
jgi:uncharacterized protein DUF6719